MVISVPFGFCKVFRTLGPIGTISDLCVKPPTEFDCRLFLIFVARLAAPAFRIFMLV